MVWGGRIDPKARIDFIKSIKMLLIQMSGCLYFPTVKTVYLLEP